MEERLKLRLEAEQQEWRDALLQATAGARSLGAEVGKATKEFNKAEEAAKKLGGIKWTELATGLNSALDLANKLGDALDKGIDLAKFGAEMNGLRKNVPTEALRAMTDATRGTVAQVDLLRFANKALTGEFHLTSDGLRIVTGAAQQLSERGFGPTLDIAKKLDEALRKGDFGELKALGINATNTKEAFEDFRKLAATPMNVDPTLTALKQMETGWADLADEIKRAAGNALSYLGNKALTTVGTIGTGLSNRFTEAAYASQDEERARALYIAENGGDIAGDSTSLAIGGYLRRAQEERGLAWQRQLTVDAAAQALELRRRQFAPVMNKTPPKKGGAAKKYKVGGAYDDFFGGAFGGLDDAASAYETGEAGGGALQAWLSEWLTQGPTSDIASIGMGALGGGAMEGADRSKRWGEFTEQIGDRTKLVGGAFGAFTDGLAAAVSAAIDGSESIGKAFMKASAAALKALAVESTVRAAYNLAMGIGSAVINPSAAPGFFAAAGQFALTATLAGAGAAALGGGGGGGGGGPHSAAGGGAASHVGGGSSQPQQQTTIVNVYGAVTAGDYAKLGGVIDKARGAADRAGRSSNQTITTRIE